MTNLVSKLKSRHITLPIKVHIVKAMIFPVVMYDVRVGPQRRLSTEELMLLSCGIGEDSWESLGLQRNQTSQSYRKSVLNIHWKDWCWNWSFNTLVTWWEEPTHWKRPWCWERLKAGGEGGNRGWDGWWHYWLNGLENEQVLEDSEGQGSLVCFSPRDCKGLDTI